MIEKKKLTILIVDDTPANVDLLTAILSPDYTVQIAFQGSEALEIARATPPDLILLDIMMPGMNGYDVCRALKADSVTQHIPVIFVTLLVNRGDEKLGFDAGCVDYITKPVVGSSVRSRVKIHLALQQSYNELESQNEELRRIRDELQNAREYAENIVETVYKPLVVLDSDLKIITANSSYYDTFTVTPKETVGNFIYEVGNRQWDIPELLDRLESIIPHDTVLNNYHVERVFHRIGHKIFLLNARLIFRNNTILLAMEDITERTQVQEERTRLAMIVESSHDAIFSVSLDDTITSWNRGAEKIFGYTELEIIGSTVFKIIPNDRHIERSHFLQTILDGEQFQHAEITHLRKDGCQVTVSITISPIRDLHDVLSGYSIIASDVTERRILEELIRHQAYHDTLTDLPNRQLFMNLLSQGLARARRSKKKLALLFLDLNGFKKVNDTLGHSCGDRLLQEVALRLTSSIRVSDTVARLGGDEFTVIMPDLAHTDDVDVVLRKILKVFETPFMLDGNAVDTTSSIGVCMFPDDGDCSEELMQKADIAMYEAKGSHSNSYQFYNTALDARSAGVPDH
jgi:diguanylate cyclase (GGDEF)-like protein/PAS domain S-box-containing protein